MGNVSLTSQLFQAREFIAVGDAHLAGQGLMNKEIATILSISPQIVGLLEEWD